MEITSEYSSWFIMVCAALGGLFTFVLYRKNAQLKELASWVIYTLKGLRFFSVFLISLLLINPLIQKWVTQTEEPVIIIAQDNSESILNNKDSVFYKEAYPLKLQELIADISSEYKVVTMPFGADVQDEKSVLDYSEKRTNYSKLFDEIEAKYAGENIGALILATDGLYNEGANPKFYNFKQLYPIYTLGLGDTTQKSDISVAEIQHNDIVYMGNKFPVNVGVNAQLLKGEKAKITIRTKGKVIAERNFVINSNNQYHTEKFVFEAESEGTQRYLVSVTEFENELNVNNNISQMLIDVIDNRDKVLILANAPHPDVAAIRGALETKDNVELKVAMISNMEVVYDAYNLIIAHGFGADENLPIWRKVWESKVPLMAVLKSDVNLNTINNLDLGFEVSGARGKPNNITGSLNDGFNSFKVSANVQKFVLNAPPLLSPYGEVNGFQRSQVFLFQKLGNVATDFPLCYMGSRNGVKTGWFFGEGLWRWKIYDFQENESAQNFNELIGKMAQYLSVKEDKSRFRLAMKRRFTESENIKIGAEFYNSSYEVVNEANASLKVFNERDEEFDFEFTPIGNTYALELGRLPAGVYRYEAKASSNVENFTKGGKFVVSPLNIEWEKVAADFNVLINLSEKTKGQFFEAKDILAITDVFKDRSKFPSITYRSETKKPVVHEKWIFFFILLLLTTEWVLRKYKGRY